VGYIGNLPLGYFTTKFGILKKSYKEKSDLRSVRLKKIESAISVAGRAVEYWGSKSISSDTSAIFELVKNARDADATKIEITFENGVANGGQITVEDNGHGMTWEDIQSKWLVAGTDFKLRQTHSKGGRRVWGEMGIGRFSCERLAKRTKMISLPKGSSEKIVMDFDWEKYKDPSITFDKVKHLGYIDNKEPKDGHGVTLVLADLKEKWDQRKIQKLKKELGSYILPPELRGPEDIEIVINAPEFDLDEEKVGSGVIKIAPLQLRAEFDGKQMRIKIKDSESKGRKFEERETKSYEGKTCGPFTFGLFFYPLDRSGETKWARYYEEHLRDLEIKDFLKNYSGIYLYRDQVWLKPYGADYDWLGLEGKRVQRRSKIGRSQVYGIVSISQDKNPEIRPTAHREVLQTNQHFEDLKSLILEAIKDLENYRDEVKASAPKEPEKRELMAGNNLGLITKLCKGKDSLTKSEIDKILQYASSTQQHIEQYKTEKEELDLEKGDLRQHELNLASIGLVTAYVAHEVAGMLENSASVLVDVRKMMETTDFTKAISGDLVKQGFEWLGTLEQNTARIGHFLSFVNDLSKHITTSKMTGGRLTQVRVKEIWDTVEKGFSYLTKSGAIECEYVESMDALKVKFDRIDLESVLANLMTNSIDAIMDAKSGGKGVIRVEVSYPDEGLVIQFSDNGTGIKLKNTEEIFEPFVTTHRTSDDDVYGHGLGLAIVREILRRHGGEIGVTSPGYYKPGTTFTIKIPAASAKRVF
jgi:signal transduction histidine kinase